MRISLFTEIFLPKIDGVVTRVTRTVEQLAELGHDVQIFATDSAAPKEFAGFPVETVPSIPLYKIYPEIKVGVPMPSVSRRLKEFQPDIVHAVNPVWYAGYGALLTRRHGIPLIASFHTDVPSYVVDLGIGFVRRPSIALIRGLHNLAEMNLVTSGPMMDTAAEYGFKNVELWPKAVDTRGYHPSKRTAAMRHMLSDGHPEAPLVLFVGRISAEKNIARLKTIMPKLRERLPGARLAFVGEGPQYEKMRQEFDPAYTHFTGYMTGEPLAEAFAAADVFAFPSLTETLGLVALESFASGVPVVGSNAGGIPFVIDDGKTGLLVDADASDDEWANALASVLSDPGKREEMSRAARAEAENWSWRAATEKLVDYYSRVCDARPSRRARG
ncbi:glycosyltransferase family 4 protein [Corynebacterium aquatimens]|uniref:Glycosyltransferase involved in cell wall biosynthesis n=1 Tax=Corynebacterium aquatimens TaxID=1190508 RepID=A0A931GST0_9CORY|nr:glycosyltransferase family 1 protein [Corynebacterium aquatimens]MBG6121170.1 glycosyltransferase involved in cell wall biosynthesis [Corynebacterium aquatimens]